MLALLKVGGRRGWSISKILGERARVVQIPELKPRHIKKCAKILRGCRVLIPEALSAESLTPYGIASLSPEELHYYLAGEIYKKTIARFCLAPCKLRVVLNAGRIGSKEEYIIEDIAKNSRHFQINAAHAEAQLMLMERYGIPQVSIAAPDIVINMYRRSFSLQFYGDGGRYKAEGITLKPHEECGGVDAEYLKSAYLYLIQAGRIAPERVKVEDVTFIYEKLT